MSKKGSSESGIPLRDERKVCYEARNSFFTCCDKNNIENPLRDDENVQKLCKGEKAKFEKDCLASWVDYFMRKRVVDKRKELMYAAETPTTIAK